MINGIWADRNTLCDMVFEEESMDVHRQRLRGRGMGSCWQRWRWKIAQQEEKTHEIPFSAVEMRWE